jgi:hypothetical protein
MPAKIQLKLGFSVQYVRFDHLMHYAIYGTTVVVGENGRGMRY